MNYTQADCWSVAEAAILVCGLTPIAENGSVSTLEPLSPGQWGRLRELRSLAYRALDTGDLPPVGKRRHGQVRPAAFLLWAATKGYPAPENLRTAFLGELPEPLCVPSDEAHTEPDSGQAEGGRIALGKRTGERRKRLDQIIEGLKDIDPDLDLKAMPGCKADLLELCQALDTRPKQFSIALRTFDNNVTGWLNFSGRKPGMTSYYRDKLETMRGNLA